MITSLCDGIKYARKLLLTQGETVKTERWQGKDGGHDFLEITHIDIKMKMTKNEQRLVDETGADMPWADIHFEERVGGIPLNPPPSHKMWRTKTDEYMSENEKFSHSYPERYWPKDLMPEGIRFRTGDLDDLINLVKSEPSTRQAVLPMFMHEDIIAASIGERVPCSLSWHFLIRNGKMDCFYSMRSCDAIRHFHNDVYFANKLVNHIIDKGELNVVPGTLQMVISSFHCFDSKGDKLILSKLVGN